MRLVAQQHYTRGYGDVQSNNTEFVEERGLQ
jgi:hypothetical protein